MVSDVFKVSLAVVYFFLIGCDSDPFGVRKETIISPYQLNKAGLEPYHFYLVGGDDSGGYGALESTVGKIGWNERYILVWQTPDGLDEGWRIVDSQTEKISKYLSEENAISDSRVIGVTVMSAHEAWRILNDN